MNLLLLLAAAWSLATRARYGHLWSLLLALCAFSLEMQVVTVVAIGDYRTVTAINVGIFLLTQLFPRCRSALVASCRDVAAAFTDAAHRLRAAVGTAPPCSVRLILCLLPIPILLIGLRDRPVNLLLLLAAAWSLATRARSAVSAGVRRPVSPDEGVPDRADRFVGVLRRAGPQNQRPELFLRAAPCRPEGDPARG